MDKVGHATTAYTLAAVQHDLMRWSGVREGPSILISSLTALTYMTAIEVMDGFSEHWGFSPGDMLANFSRISFFSMQQAVWNEQRVALKFSFHYSPFASYNPRELGENWRSRIIKDYNGQSYWLSFRIKPFLPSRAVFPSFLNLAVGYGAEGMLGARTNPLAVDGRRVPVSPRYRQFYVGPDVDFRALQGKALPDMSAFLLQFLKTPAPALEWNTALGTSWHWLYF